MKSALVRHYYTMEEVFEVSVVDEEDRRSDEHEEDGTDRQGQTYVLHIPKSITKVNEAMTNSEHEVNGDKTKVCHHCGSKQPPKSQVTSSSPASTEEKEVDVVVVQVLENSADNSVSSCSTEVEKTNPATTTMADSSSSQSPMVVSASSSCASSNHLAALSQVQLAPKWRIKEPGEPRVANNGTRKRYDGTLEPWCKQKKAKLMTASGPVEVRSI